MDTPLTGRCQCGAVTYTVTAEPLFTYACHCGSCQKRTGSAFSMGSLVPLDALQLEGELTAWSRRSDQGYTNTRFSCADCGNIIYGEGETSPGLAKLQTGTLDETTGAAPDVHMWTCNKQAWVELPRGVPRFDTQPQDPAELLRAAMDWRAAQ